MTEQKGIGAGFKYDLGKLRFSLIPLSVIWALMAVLDFGARKYQAHSWRNVENAKERYYDALMRHVMDYRGGNHIDEESGLPTLAHAYACLTFLLAIELEELGIQSFGKSTKHVG